MNPEVFKQIANEVGVSEEVVKEVYLLYWLFIKETIKELPLKEDLSEEEFNSLKTNFSLPYLGKISCTYQKYKGVKQKQQYKKKRK